MQSPLADSPLQYMKGVGPRRADALATIGLRTVDDLLSYFPFRYELETGVVDIEDLQLGTTATVCGEVVDVRYRPGVIRAWVSDGTGECILCWFNQNYLGQRLQRGCSVIATGKVGEFDGDPELVQPTIQTFAPGVTPEAPSSGTRIVGVYSGTATCKSNMIRRTVDAVLNWPDLPIVDELPDAVRARHKLPPRSVAIRSMHRPADQAALDAARRRLAFDEFFMMELAMALRRRRNVALQKGRKLHCTAEIDQRIRARFPFSLTAAQDKTIREIAGDLGSGRPMTRLLQGDVGSGKTVVALYACLLAMAGGRQAAIMGPTEILAQQHFNNIEKYLAGSRVKRAMLSGRLSRGERTKLLEQIEAGELDLIVGTQALLEGDVAFKDLAVVVVDEQHKFGVLQRATFRTKGPMPHYLVMTATPIPRTLAMTVFGDLDVSVINSLPPGRQPIETRIVAGKMLSPVLDDVRRRLEAGEQAYVVCSMIGSDGSESSAPTGTVEQPPSAAAARETLPLAKPSPAHFRRNLPHFQADGRALFITFRTYKNFVLPDAARDLVLKHCLFENARKAHMHAICVMPDHVHLLLTCAHDATGNPYGLSEILNGIKGASAHSINKLLERSGAVWQSESFDHMIRRDESLKHKAEYLLDNPMRKGLVRAQTEYRWLWQEGRSQTQANHSEKKQPRAAAPQGVGTRPRAAAPQGVGTQPGTAVLPGASKGILSVTQVHKLLSDGRWRGLNIGLLHGGMKSDEKQRVMAEFAANRLHAIVSTTVVEVGVDVPNATIMIIENAERFGLSQLHQLRGRVGRGSKASLCILVDRSPQRRAAASSGSSSAAAGMGMPLKREVRAAKTAPISVAEKWATITPQAAANAKPGSKAAERLSVLAQTTDGFKIAEADLRLRGPGELFGTKQHGLPELRIGDLVRDFELLEHARREAFDLIAADPELKKAEHAPLVPALRRMFGKTLALIDAG
ncbi:MAG: REP-associated tyrosine transposase [Phycisphaerae bacterium]